MLVAAATVVTGCADGFAEQDRNRDAGQFSTNPNPPMQQQEQTPSSPPPTDPGAPTGPCPDPDPTVIATCLDTTSGVLPGNADATATVVAQRTTGKIVRTKRGGPTQDVASFEVDASGDGGLLDFAFSPDFAQDQLLYAYITTPTDNRVVRLAPNDVPKPILVGIPKGPVGNMGTIHFKSPTELLVATGDAGDPQSASDPSSLAGKILSVTDLASGSTTPPRVLTSGLGSNPALCPDVATGALYLTDRAPAEDRLQLISATGVARTLWTWPDKPETAGCAAVNGMIMVSQTKTQRLQALAAPTEEKPTTPEPVTVLEKRYGSLGRLTAVPGGLFQVATVNKQTGTAGPTDDRVIIIPMPQGPADTNI
ncbi:PQQ-dependent sugar dehydrogenase [Williamsia muralis]